MSVENELKMIPREKIKSEEILNLLQSYGYIQNDALKLSRQEDTYYDDKNKTLYKNNCSFRIRKKGKNFVVTYKSPIDSNTEYKQREELEADIPEMYIQENGTVMVEDAIDILRRKYPDVNIPKDLVMAVKVVNNRNKANIISKDNSVIEMAFDDLHIENARGNTFEMNNEMECELISGKPEVLSELYNTIYKNYDIQKNELSKYSRAIKEMNEQRDNMSLDEVTICSMLSSIINTKEFQQLSHKGQMIHDYRIEIPDNLKLDNFKDPEYLIEKISEIKRTKNYKPGKIKTLEDMFLCFFSDMSYRDIEYRLVNFLNDNYYREGTPITNRMLHSEQVMLITGLISKSKEISENERNSLLCMTSALVHDIGHVPGAHPTEQILGDLDGFFSHEINGRNVLERVITENENNILNTIKSHMEEVGTEYSDEKIKEYIQKNKILMKKSIEAHSRTNSEKRGDGTAVQLPREADKICYCASDIADILKRARNNDEFTVKFFTDEWKEEMISTLGKGYEKSEIIKQKIEAIEKLINTNNFGEITTSIANTVRENINDGKTYYDVEQDTWDIVNGMIKNVKDLRKFGTVDNKRTQLQYAVTFFIVRKFNESLAKCNGNIDMAWDKAIQDITQSNDLDILNSLNEIKEMYKNQSEELKNAYLEGGILDTSKIQKLDNSDRQIKIQPRGKFQISDLQPCLGQNWATPEPESIKDIYFLPQEGLSLCLREYVGTTRKQFIMKRKRDKDGVTQVEREKYVSESYNGAELQELIEQFNAEHPDFKIDKPVGAPECIIETTRNNTENEQGVMLRRDRSTIITDAGKIEMPETIEIECSDRNEIKEVKRQLSEFLDKQEITLKAVSTKETKEEQAMRLIEEQEQSR